ncbi:EF-hand [Gonapodya prolifera JEL478]|uniref:EF-hand n=1 Tax=Gonapodya prolifera (strain JEL478) TaxID=1344416 RepID=A0A139AWF7_GONPJ|nr:EF-hand [Gonapodya prolifera JEL478]|eukprot:KXS21058.1 EF-hand [Gonapodya prolifera JEL478]
MKDSKSTAATDSTRGPAIEQQRKHQRVSSRGRPPLVYDRAEPLKRRAARVQKLFEELDRDRTGYIEYGDLKSKLQSLTPTKQLREETVEDYSNHFMERVDLNHDQKISFEEFSIFVESKERELWDLFSQLDSRGDGFIRRDDLVVAFKEAGIKIDRTGLDSFMRDVDRDGNGASNVPMLQFSVTPIIYRSY